MVRSCRVIGTASAVGHIPWCLNRFAAPLGRRTALGLVLLLGALTAVQMNGCGTPARVAPCLFPDDLQYDAPLDSLGLDSFVALPADVQAERRRAAADRRAGARSADRCDRRVQGLANAAGLAPDHPQTWLELAELLRWIGDYQTVQSDLTQAAATVKFAPHDERRALRYDIALEHAWLHYDRGEWRKGLAWADSASAISPEEDLTLLIKGLLLAGSGQYRYAEDQARELERRDVFSNTARWIMGLSEWYRGRKSVARSYFSGLEGVIPQISWRESAGDHISAAVRPGQAFRAECWRDLATLEEQLGGFAEARRRYERSAAALPHTGATCLTQIDYSLLSTSAKKARMPVWIAFDRFYVTGSRSAYTALAVARFQGAATAADRQFWAEQAVNSAGVCIRKGIDKEYALRERGVLYVKLEMYDKARSDLRRARRIFEHSHHADARLLVWLGHLNMQEDRYLDALPMLQQAVELVPRQAMPWSDLGLALIKSGNVVGAKEALDKAIALDPQLAVAWYNRGLLYYHDQRWPEAIADLEQAARLAPNNPDVAQVLQQAAEMQRRAKKAGG